MVRPIATRFPHRQPASVPPPPTGARKAPAAKTSGILFEDSLPYASPSFALAVSHCPWVPERAANMQVLRPKILRAGPYRYREITDKAPNYVWSRIMWGWLAAQPVTHGVCLQDDVRIIGDFWSVVEAMVRAVPNRVISLISNHPFSERALASGHAWFRMCEVLGTGYVIPTALMGCFLEWRDRHVEEELRVTCEDFLITSWLAETGRKAWCPVPTIIQTMDSEIRSTNPDVSYPHQRSYLTADDPSVAGKKLADVDYWKPSALPPDFGYCVSNDVRFPKGPFNYDEVFAAHRRLARR